MTNPTDPSNVPNSPIEPADRLRPAFMRALYEHFALHSPHNSPTDNDEAYRELAKKWAEYLDDGLRKLGAPELEGLGPEHVDAYIGIRGIDDGNGERFSDFVARLAKEKQAEEARLDLRMPHWYAKTEDKSTQWIGDTEHLDRQRREQLDALFRDSVTGSSRGDVIGGPAVHPVVIDDLVDAMAGISSIFVWSAGYGNLTDGIWRWGASLATNSGLGFRGLRRLAAKLGEDDEDWAAWATMDDDALLMQVREARELTGYGPVILRAPYARLQEWAVEADATSKWLYPVIGMHLLKHVRLDLSHPSAPALRCIYNGRRAVMSFDPNGLVLPLSSPAHRNLKAQLMQTLGVRSGRGDPKPIDEKINAVMCRLHPAHFPRLREVDERRLWVPPPSVRLIDAPPAPANERGWIATGTRVAGVYEIDPDRCEVRPAVIEGADALTYRWNLVPADPVAELVWKSTLPARIEPRRPSALIFDVIRNINDLGNRAGLAAGIDALFFADVLRNELAGTPVGNALRLEYPLVVIAPMGTTRGETTNQGKTLLLRAIGNMLVPFLDVTQLTKSTSAPSIRASFSSFSSHGTALFDEFILPTSTEHPLGQAGLQSLTVGVHGTPGRVGENDVRVTLRHPLMVSMKVVALPLDLLNRLFAIFLDTLTPETRATATELADILSGAYSFRARLAALAWLEKHPEFVQATRSASLLQGAYRFNGHLTIAALLESQEAFESYVLAAQAQCERQRIGAEATGLAEDIGVRPGFDPTVLFNDDMPFDKFEVVKGYLESDNRSTMATTEYLLGHDPVSALRLYNCTLGKARTALVEAIDAGRMVAHGYAMVIEERLNNQRKRRRYVGLKPLPEEMDGATAPAAA